MIAYRRCLVNARRQLVAFGRAFVHYSVRRPIHASGAIWRGLASAPPALTAPLPSKDRHETGAVDC
jgi:hypothetical protein